jgi:hypothetical protein
MGRTAVENIVPGMKLAKPITNQSGMVMLGENTELNPFLIEKIKDMGITSVYIYGVAKTLAPKEEVLAQLDERFRSVETQPYMGQLKKALQDHIEGMYEEHGPDNPEG